MLVMNTGSYVGLQVIHCMLRVCLDLRVTAIKSTWLLQVKSFQFQVASEIFHSSRRKIIG